MATIDSLVDQLSVMRGAAMKAGQVLSTVEFPGLDADQAEYLQRRLASLRDSVPRRLLDADARRCSRANGASSPRRCSPRSGPEPAAAASIGQVYRAPDPQDGEVAVKVQYPGIAEAVESDMRNLRMLAPSCAR